LSRVWSDISRQIEEQSGQLPLRTSILTLIVVARGKIETRLAHATLHELVEQMPSRAIIIEVGRPGSEMNATVSAHCLYRSQNRAACYEVIELRVPSDRLVALPSLLQPLELYDVPSFLWWVGAADFRAPDFIRLSESAERIIVDSSRFDSPVDALASFQAYLQSADISVTGTDLNWARSTSWRELTAQCFDHPRTADLLNAFQTVEIAFDPSGEAQGWLLAGWLATRLGWRLVNARRSRETTTLALYTSRGEEVTVTLTLQATSGFGLRSVRLLVGSGMRTSRIVIRRRTADLTAIAIEGVDIPRQERIVRDAQPRLCDLIGKELLIHTRDRVFEESLDFVAGVVRQLGGQRG
jgi:glucose-6-phosphate dehydrogenase assembly protein OpcA